LAASLGEFIGWATIDKLKERGTESKIGNGETAASASALIVCIQVKAKTESE